MTLCVINNFAQVMNQIDQWWKMKAIMYGLFTYSAVPL